MKSVAAVSPAEIARSDRRNFVRNRILLTQASRLWSKSLGRGNFVSAEAKKGVPTQIQSSTTLPMGMQRRAKLLSNEVYKFPRVGCQGGNDFEIYSFGQHPCS